MVAALFIAVLCRPGALILADALFIDSSLLRALYRRRRCPICQTRSRAVTLTVSKCYFRVQCKRNCINPITGKNCKTSPGKKVLHNIMGLPLTNDHGRQILFGPEDGHLYVMMGDGGGRNDPYNFSMNKKSIMGKILRLDLIRTPSMVLGWNQF